MKTVPSQAVRVTAAPIETKGSSGSAQAVAGASEESAKASSAEETVLTG